MKNTGQPQEIGRKYWRSLDELGETPEFRQWLEREFPEGASEWTDPVSRRHFVKIMSASFLLAGLGFATSGCRRPEERILPFSKTPEDYVHGVARYYATAMPGNGGVATPLVVRSNDGRPTKVEGNSLIPELGAGTDKFAQASILNLYDPDRATHFREKGDVRTREAAAEVLAELARSAAQSRGKGLCFLMQPGNSPTRNRLQALITKQFPEARWFADDPGGLHVHRQAAALAFGRPVRPRLLLENADVVVSLDADVLGLEANSDDNLRRFTKRRFLDKAEDANLNRLYVVESLYSVTGFAADHRLRLASSAVGQLAAALAAQIGGEPLAAVSPVEAPAGVDPKWIAACAKDLAAHKGRSLVVAGHRQPLAVHLLAHAMNAALGNIGRTIAFLDDGEQPLRPLNELAEMLNAGQVETLVILGANPVYTAPADLKWAEAQGKARNVIRLGYYEDETFSLCRWHLPQAHYLESWGDARAVDGTLLPIQPLIAPLFGGWTEIEVLARIAGAEQTTPYGLVRQTFEEISGAQDAEATWRKFLHDGYLAGSAAKPVGVQFNTQALVAQGASIQPAPALSKDRLEVIFHRDYSVDDGRYSNNGWLQEMPDPITKIVWDNVVLMSRKTARELGLVNSDLVEVKLGDRSVRGPVWVQPGMADYSLGLALGYGREKIGRVAKGVGFNAYPLRTVGAGSIASGATVSATGKTYPISCTQTHWSMEGRPAVREVNLDQYREHPDFVHAMSLEHGTAVSMYPNPLDKITPSALHQWGMAIDLNRCVGCSACVIACQSENNVPIVGKDQVARGREMHWLRIDRYYAGKPLVPENSAEAARNLRLTYPDESKQQFQDWIDNPQVVTQPMLCQHCEAAPCENVCPVNATSHDQEGLNVMTYNRCVGTRYCSNNCPYKVRRFNFFDYNKRPIDKLYWGPLAERPEDEWDLIRMIKNPDVTVRMRGVMEKCTFCIQRIEGAKIAQKTKAGASGDVVVPEGTFTTACAQACPANAIAFGNLNDPESGVSKLKKQQRNYSVLEELFTRPRTTYLARVRNPNKEMPDYYDAPATFKEYEQRMGNPFKHHASTEGHGAPHHPAEKGGH